VHSIRIRCIFFILTFTLAACGGGGSAQHEPGSPSIGEAQNSLSTEAGDSAVSEPNEAPHFSLSLNASNAKRGDTVDLTVSNVTDKENDPINFSTQWYVNDNPLTGETSNELRMETAVFGDIVSAIVTGGIYRRR